MIPGAKQNPPPKPPAEKPNPNQPAAQPTNANKNAPKNDTKNPTAPPSKPDPPKEAPKPVKPPKLKRKSKPKKPKKPKKSKSKSPKAKKRKQNQKTEPLPKSNQQPTTKPPLPPKSPSKGNINASSPKAKPVPVPVPPPRASNSKLNYNDYASRKYPSAPDPDFQRQRQFYGSTEIPNQQTDADTPEPETEAMDGNSQSQPSSRSSKGAISSVASQSPAPSRQPSVKSSINETRSRIPSQARQPSVKSLTSEKQSRIPSQVGQLSAKSSINENQSRIPSQIRQPSLRSPISENQSRKSIPTPPRKPSQTQMQETFIQSPTTTSKRESRIPSEMNQLSPQLSSTPVNKITTPPRNPSQAQLQDISAQSPLSTSPPRNPTTSQIQTNEIERVQSQSQSPFSRNQSRISSEMNQLVLPAPVPVPVPMNMNTSPPRNQSPSQSQSPMKETAMQSPIISPQQSRKQSQNQELAVKSSMAAAMPMSKNASIIQSQMSQLQRVESPVMKSQSRFPSSSQIQEPPVQRESRMSNPATMTSRLSQSQMYPVPVPAPVPSTRNQSPPKELNAIQSNANSNSKSRQYSFGDLSNANTKPDSNSNPAEPPQNNNTEPPEPVEVGYNPNDGYVPNWDDRENGEPLKIFSTQKGDDPEEHKMSRSEEEILWNPGFVCYVLLITSLTHYVYFALATVSSNMHLFPKSIGIFFWVPLPIFIILSIFSRKRGWSRDSPGNIIIFLTFITLWSMFWTLFAFFLSPSSIVASIVETIASNCFILAVLIRIKGNFNLKSGTIYIVALGVLFFHVKVKLALAFIQYFTTTVNQNVVRVETVEKILINASISNVIGGLIFLYICFELQAILLGKRSIAWPTQTICGALSLYEDIIWLLFECAKVVGLLIVFSFSCGCCCGQGFFPHG